MGKTSYMRLKGSQHLRQRLLLSTLSSTPILIEDIRPDDTSPGLRSHEVSFLRLLEKISDDCTFKINETGTKLMYKPGMVIGGKHLLHDCGLSRSIGYFLEPLVVLGLFAKKPLSIRLKGGHITWVDEGIVKSIRGVTFSTWVYPQIGNRIVYAAREVFNRFLPNVHIFTDHKFGPSAGSLEGISSVPIRSPSYGISLVADTISGCLISADTAVCYTRAYDMDGFEDSEEKPELMPPEEVGVQVASMLLGEIEQGGVVDSTHQGLLFLLCALSPQDVSKVRVGKLTLYGIETLRHIRDFLGVKFAIKPDPTTNTVILKCVGCRLQNLSRREDLMNSKEVYRIVWSF